MRIKDLFKKQYKDIDVIKRSTLIVESDSPLTDGAFTKEYLGLAIYDGSLAPLIERGSRVPVEKSYVFSTWEDGQDQMILKLYRSIELEVEYSFSLGQFQIIGIPNMPAKEPQIQVTFCVDDKNIYMYAKDLIHGNYMEVIKIFQN